ncbi:MAG: flagellar basal body rod protein FlgB [Alphaproteobacteria bacterium]|nr:flagellar basal body rod protein FlgB [Alphaproteobacteria bacterium]
MDPGSIPLFQAMARRMSWLSERQSVLAQNVANADTPGYAAQDLKPITFRDLLSGKGGRLALTASGGNSLTGTRPANGFSSTAAPAPERTLSGNAVNLEGEMMKVAETTADYQLALDLYRKHIGMLKAALGHS